MGVREFRVDSERDPDGRELREQLEAQFAHERAVLRRELLEHLTVLLAIVLWLSNLVAFPAWVQQGAILLFAPALTGLVVSSIVEWRS
jgi:hypothetical protein